MLEKARDLASDAVFLDLEDSVSPLAKVSARANVIAALIEGGFGQRAVSVRINAVDSQWSADDLTQVIEHAGDKIDCILVPKVQNATQLLEIATRITQIESTTGIPAGTIGIEAQIEDALGLVNVDQIAAASDRLESLVFGPADFMASINMKSLVVGQQPAGYTEGDAYHYPLMRLLVAGRAFGKQVIDGPYLGIKDLDGLRVAAHRSAALGFDGKWVLHPDQIDVVNEIFSPEQSDYDHAEMILDAYEFHTSSSGGARGAVMLGDEMIDEASRKMALVISAKGRAAGMVRTTSFVPER
jgi:citrate lyase subunit beta/citryl-CoA lyase